MNLFKRAHTVLTSAALLLTLGLTACDQAAPTAEGTAFEANASANSHATPMAFQAAPEGSGFPVGTLFPPTGGSSLLKRGSDYVRINVNTNGLPEAVYTSWWVVFNNPAACSDDVCGLDDFPANGGDPAVDASLLWAAGGLVHHNGTLHVRATLVEGMPAGEVVFGPGLQDAENAVIHYAIRSHGPASDDPDILEDQLTLFGGGCGEYPCFNTQIVVH